MAGIFTRKTIAEIMANEALTPEERTDLVFSLYGRALEDGYVTKLAAKAAQESAVEAARAQWEKALEKPDVLQSDEYRALADEFDAYRAMQGARTSAEYRDVKPKFFETVYAMVDRGDGAKPVTQQLEDIRERYEEYFLAGDSPDYRAPRFGAPVEGSMPRGEGGAEAEFARAWGFGR